MPRAIYLDYAAATPMDARVLVVMRPYFTSRFFNPSANYLAARRVHYEVEAARARVALALGARAGEITFTAGGTEANNLSIHGIMQSFPGKKILVSQIEHQSVLAMAHQYACQEVPVSREGQIDIEALKKLIDDDTVLVSVMYANNEVGTIQPLKEVGRILRTAMSERRSRGNDLPIYLHTDAAQAASYLDLHVARLEVDLMTLNGGKLYGPKQTGVLYKRTDVALKPMSHGGGQERGLRSGTENVPSIIGFTTALEISEAMRHEEVARLHHLQNLFFALIADKLPMAVVNGSRTHRLPNNIHITLPGQDNERLLMSLDEAGIMAAAGSACSASDQEPSHVLRAMGLNVDEARASLRFTMGRGTTEQEVRRTIEVLARLVAPSL